MCSKSTFSDLNNFQIGEKRNTLNFETMSVSEESQKIEKSEGEVSCFRTVVYREQGVAKHYERTSRDGFKTSLEMECSGSNVLRCGRWTVDSTRF